MYCGTRVLREPTVFIKFSSRKRDLARDGRVNVPSKIRQRGSSQLWWCWCPCKVAPLRCRLPKAPPSPWEGVTATTATQPYPRRPCLVMVTTNTITTRMTTSPRRATCHPTGRTPARHSLSRNVVAQRRSLARSATLPLSRVLRWRTCVRPTCAGEIGPPNARRSRVSPCAHARLSSRLPLSRHHVR